MSARAPSPAAPRNGPMPPATPAARAATAAEPGAFDPSQALVLLQQAGRAAPEGEPGTVAWLEGLVRALVDLSSRDPLTGLPNRRPFELALEREMDRVARAGEPALLLMVDIDHFKAVNDTYGHAAGDIVLREVAQTLARTVRPMDLVARLGGEEFGILLPNCASAFGPQVAGRLRARVSRLMVDIAPGQAIGVTVSIGGAFAPQWVRSTSKLWLERADQQLYRAKHSGRDRVCLEPSASAQVTAEERVLLFGTAATQDPE